MTYDDFSGRALLLLDAAPAEWEPLPDDYRGLEELTSAGLVETDSHMAGPFPSDGYRRVWRRKGMPS